MSENYLFCNYNKCKAPITKFTWVTRCSHVFCEEHGNSFFYNRSSKIKCPVCNESIVRDSDVIKTNLNTHDMMLSCVRPEKALDYVINATKLWNYQMTQKNKVNIDLLSEKYENIANNAMSKLKSENSEMKKFIMEVERKLKCINAELSYTKRKLGKYKLAYNKLCAKNHKSPSGSDVNPSFFQNFLANTYDENLEDILQYGDMSNFDNMSGPDFD